MKYLYFVLASAFALNMSTINFNDKEEIIWETPKDVNAITKTDDTHYSMNLTYYNEIITSEYGEVNMWANLTTYDGPVPADGTYFFQYMQIEQPIKPGTYESFSCWAQFNRETSYVPENEITVVNYYGT